MNQRRILNTAIVIALSWGAVRDGGAAEPDDDEGEEDPAARSEFRLQRLRDEHGHFDPDDLFKALQQKKLLRENPRLFGSATRVGPSVVTPGSWQEIGPGNIGGRLRSILIDPTTPATMYLGGVSGGIWKTTDGGASWAPLDDMMVNLSISCMAMDPRNPAVLYAGTGEFWGVDFRGAGIFKSTDAGAHWTRLTATANDAFQFVNRLAISPADSAVLLAATSTGIFRSTDGGAQWSSVLASPAADLDFHPTDGTKAIAGAWGGTYVSNDAGVTWTVATGFPTTIGVPHQSRIEVAYAPSSPTTVYASLDRNSGEVYRSTDGGASYTLRSTGTGYLNQGHYANTVFVDPTNANNVIVGGLTLQFSTDGGSTFAFGPANFHVDQHIVVAHPQFATNKTIFFGNDGGIYRADSMLQTATSLNHQLRISQFYSGVGNVNSSIVLGGTQDNGALRYAGDSEGWVRETPGDGSFCATDPLLEPDGSSIFYTNSQGDLGPFRLRFDRAGTLTDTVVWNLPQDQYQFIPPIALDPNGGTRLYKGGRNLWKLDNPRTAPAAAQFVSIKPPSFGGPLSTISVAPGNSDVIWVGESVGNVFATTDGTAATPTWLDKSRNTPTLPFRVVTSIAIDPTNADRVYVTYGGFSPDNVWKTEDGGFHWTDVTGNLPDVPVHSLAIWPYRTDRLYVGTEIGVFASEDGGATWSPSNQGPSSAPIGQLFWMRNTLVAATFGRSMFRVVVDDPPSVALTSPADGATVTPGAPLDLAATAADANGTVTQVEFLDGAAVLGVDTTSPYTFAWANVAEGQHVLTARATDNDGNVTTSDPITIQARPPLPPPWVSGDVGAVGQPGSASEASGTFTLRGSGADVGGSSDAFQFVNRPLGGDGVIVARVAMVGNTNAGAKAGVMIRESLAANARNAFMALTAGSGTRFQTRTTAGGSTASSNTSGVAAPFWVRLVRSGNSFTAFRSSDGTTWTQQGSAVTIAMPSAALVGLAYTAHDNTALGTATISNVTVTSGHPAALFVVGNTTLNSGDTALRNRLQGQGYTLTIKSASSAVTADANGKALVLVSSTGASTATSSKFRTVAVPVIVNEASIFDDMGMTGATSGTDFGTTGSQTQLAVVAPTHPLAGGLSGTVTVTTAAGSVNFGVPQAAAARVAAVASNAAHFAVFGYDTGAAMVGLTAPARRVGTFLTDTTAASLTLAGWTLFDAAVKWAAGVP